MPCSIQSTLDEIAIIGASCILPGADTLDALWQLLLAEKNTITARPHGRWNVERFLRPGKPTAGFSYSFAGGYLDKAFAFDPAPFNISPREALQMDPQQRLLLTTAWRALEDAGLPPSSLAGRNVGVYVGASAADYQSAGAFDPAVIGSHFMTGNALSILANRISHVFDLKGPSFTVDTACSSSFVALAQAMAALRAGEIELAVVGGVNMLLSPVPFIGFSQARMLSPTGLCRPFSEDGDGYVRSEGAAVLILQRLPEASAPGRRIRSIIVAAETNSDGWTNGISLPSQPAQQRLIERIYAKAGIAPEQLAFIEAHGTGTKIGDPIEAAAISGSLARHRSVPLPIGSIKSNIGHLEAASGLAALLKTSLALEHALAPRSLFAGDRNEAIDFEALNLAPITSTQPIAARDGGIIAGICNYGFGGTNAHVILRSASKAQNVNAVPRPKRQAGVLMVSASGAEALQQRARQIAERLSQGAQAPAVASALAYQREILPHRLAIPLSSCADATALAEAALRGFGAGEPGQGRSFGATAHGAARRTVFVFSGNGAQYPQMGQLAYRSNEAFRQEIDEIDQLYRPLAGWSIAEQFHGGISAERFERTSVAQPLIFAVQSALAAILRRYGVEPAAVIGHSVGEIAAAECSGSISRAEALRILQIRSEHQEFVRGMGRMLVLATDSDSARRLLDGAGADALDLAAYNGPDSVTVSGPADQIAAVAAFARQQRVATVPLQVDYPFHSRALDVIEARIVADLAGVSSRPATVPFFSTVTGAALAPGALDARYWWENIRRPVRFVEAMDAALAAFPEAGFIELAARPILLGPIADLLRAREAQGPLLPTLAANDPATQDPVAAIAARIAASGLHHAPAALFGDAPRDIVALPPYPMQCEDYRFEATSEAVNAHGRLIDSTPLHPLLGARVSNDACEWRNLLDPVLLPYLDDHRVDGGVVLPAAALIEMALAAGSERFGAVPLEIDEFDITRAMTFGDDETREVATRYFEHTETVEISSRRRFDDDWLLHARGSLRRVPTSAATAQPAIPQVADPILSDAPEIYAAAERAGLDYGPRFRIVRSTSRDETVGETRMAVPGGGSGAYQASHILHPISLDASFHGLFLARPQRDGERKAFLPIRFRQIRVWKPGTDITHAVTKLLNETDRFKTLSVALLDADGGLVGSIEAAIFRSVHLVRPFMADRTFREEHLATTGLPLPAATISGPEASLGAADEARQTRLLLKAFCLSLAKSLCLASLPADGSGTLEDIAADGSIAAEAQPLFALAREVLGMAGGLESTISGTRLSPSLTFPSPEVLLGTLLQRFPQANRELRLAAQALGAAPLFLRLGKPEPRSAAFDPEQWGLQSFSAPLRCAVAGALASWTSAAARKLRILLVGDWNHGLMEALAPAVLQNQIAVTFAVENPARAEEQRHRPGIGSLFEILALDGADRPRSAAFDALVGFSLPLSPWRATNDAALAGALDLLATGAPILLAEPGEDAHLAFLLGAATPSIWHEQDGASPDRQGGFERRLDAAGASEISVQEIAEGALRLVGARAKARGEQRLPAANIALLAEPGGSDPRAAYGLGQAMLFDLAATGELGPWLAALPAGEAATIIVAPDAAPRPPRERLAARIEGLSELLKLLGSAERPCRLFVLTESARTGDTERAGEDAGVWAFIRVAINEFPEIDLRLIDLTCAAGAAHVGTAVALDNAERELRITAAGIEICRLRRGMVADTPLGPDERAVLHFADGAGLDGFEWHRQPRRAPAEGEIEVEIAATGLNYRDVLVGLGLLDDDLLGAGLTRAALGFECSGRVLRVGPGVTRHRPGDAVMGFAAGAFASHVTGPDWHFFPVPDKLCLEAAATIPVVFATAWYALVERGQIRAGESVLVHGAAGGVGLAAIQIAKLKGARVLGTASNEARRAIARAAGADEVFDSRQERFAGPIQHRFGGVDIVLNSLAGPAMLASFKLLKPFGRFLELGKRDFLANTQLALRPFVRNIAYSGVDLDELLAAAPELVRAMMTALAEAFRQGDLRPLTYRSFEGHEVGAAFRSMQASDHVGKIVIRPPAAARTDIASLTYAAPAGLHLVVGGTAGLGLATAQWLVRRGATRVALLSRRGQVEPELAPVLAEMRAAGAQVLIEALDVTDAAAVREMVSRLTAAHGPVRGVIHAAVHLDDGLIANLSAERLTAVLRTKVDGVINLDAATRDQPLAFFVAYSSATTLVGSPGQAAYVAANGFLEGFMRQRRQAGRPALAIGWGAISDVGIIARDKQLGQRLRRTTGVVPMRAFEALAHLGRLLSLGDRIEPVQFLAGITATGSAERLPLLRSAAFAELGHAGGEVRREQNEELTYDLRNRSRADAIAIVTGILRREVADILRMAESKVDLSRPLSELGLDSLMALELHMALETAMGVQIAVVGAGDRNLGDMAGAIVGQLTQTEDAAEPAPAEGMQATIVRLANVHSSLDLSGAEASRIEQMVRSSGRGSAR